MCTYLKMTVMVGVSCQVDRSGELLGQHASGHARVDYHECIPEMGRPTYCGWYRSLAGILEYINGEWELSNSMHSLFSGPDGGRDVTSCFELLPS